MFKLLVDEWLLKTGLRAEKWDSIEWQEEGKRGRGELNCINPNYSRFIAILKGKGDSGGAKIGDDVRDFFAGGGFPCSYSLEAWTKGDRKEGLDDVDDPRKCRNLRQLLNLTVKCVGKSEKP